jgi:dTDP-4-dehydrorhamnose 3,5-epimerase-like enzyme
MLEEVRLLEQKVDSRGRVFEVLRREHLPHNGFGQIYVFTVAPKEIKGNHYHTRKIEWFCVLRGEGELVLYDRSNGENQTVKMREDNPAVMMIRPGIAHVMRNTGPGELIVLAYITEPFDPNDPDTYYFDIGKMGREANG